LKHGKRGKQSSKSKRRGGAGGDAREKRRGGASKSERGDTAILLIAAFKLLKGLLLLAVAVGALALIDENVGKLASDWIAALRVDPKNRFIHAVFVKLTRVDNTRLEEISAGSFFYAALLSTEGVGLFLRKPWAEYLTIVATASFIPLEIYELLEEFSKTKLLVLLINAAVVVYLILRVLNRRRDKNI